MLILFLSSLISSFFCSGREANCARVAYAEKPSLSTKYMSFSTTKISSYSQISLLCYSDRSLSTATRSSSVSPEEEFARRFGYSLQTLSTQEITFFHTSFIEQEPPPLTASPKKLPVRSGKVYSAAVDGNEEGTLVLLPPPPLRESSFCHSISFIILTLVMSSSTTLLVLEKHVPLCATYPVVSSSQTFYLYSRRPDIRKTNL